MNPVPDAHNPEITATSHEICTGDLDARFDYLGT